MDAGSSHDKTPSLTPSPKPKYSFDEHQNTHRALQYDMLNHFFMHPSDDPSLALFTPYLSNSNYHSWSHSIKMALISKNKLGLIDGSLTRLITFDNNQIDWDHCNIMVMLWITNYIEQEISESILWMNMMLEIWGELRKRYHQGDIFRISDLQEEIYSLRQGEFIITQYEIVARIQ